MALGVFARDWGETMPARCCRPPARPGAGAELGLRLGSGSGHCRGRGCGSNLARFFLNRTTRVWCCKRVSTRSATRPLRYNRWKEPLQRFLSRTNSYRTVATARTPKDGFALPTIPRSAINSAPLCGLKHKEQNSFSSLTFTAFRSEKESASEGKI